jgi:hypothetical protein
LSSKAVILATFLVCSVGYPALTRLEASAQSVAALSDSASISLITVLPGEAVYSLFGHSALRVRDPDQNIDYSFSYGTFHFDDPMFVPKFTRGDLDYYLSVAYFDNALRLYRDVEGRPVIEQRLALSSDQQNRLFEFLQENAKTENRYYRYDFLFDNCSTRIRDALETALAGEVSFEDSDSSAVSFRDLLAPYLTGRSFLRLGIGLLLGVRVDRRASPRETTFLPDHLSSLFDNGVLTDSTGARRSLVLRRDTLLIVPSYRRAESGFPWAGLMLGTICSVLAVITLLEARRGQINERVDVFLFGLVGLVGCFLLFMWFGTSHNVTAANWNLAWAWPTHLVYAGLLARRGLSPQMVRYSMVSAAAMAILVAMWELIPQDLPEPALAVALMVAMRGAWTALYARKKKAGETLLTGPGD